MNEFRRRQLAALTAPLNTSLQGLQVTVGTSDGTTVDDRNRLIMGQDYPTVAAGEVWAMSNRRNYYAIQALQTLVAGLSTQLGVLTDTLGTDNTALQARLALAEANLTSLLAQQHSDEADIAALHAYTQSARLAGLATEAKATQTASDLAAIALRVTAQEALNALQNTRLAAEEAQTTLLQAAVVTAQNTATAAQAAAATAQAKADADAVLAQQAQAAATAAQATASTAITNAAAAQATATTALTEERAITARIRTLRLTTAGGTLTVATPFTYPVTWATPFADANYSIEITRQGTSLLGVQVAYTNKTAAGCTVTLSNTGLASLAIGAGVLDLTALHD